MMSLVRAQLGEPNKGLRNTLQAFTSTVSVRGTYISLIASSRLNTYLAEIDKQAQERFERLIEGMKQAQGITNQLKAENQLEWVQRINNIRAYAMEIVNEEIIYA